MDGMWLSNGMVLQSNHGHGNSPRNIFVSNQIVRIGFLLLIGLKEEKDKSGRMQYLEEFGVWVKK